MALRKRPGRPREGKRPALVRMSVTVSRESRENLNLLVDELGEPSATKYVERLIEDSLADNKPLLDRARRRLKG